MTDAELTMLEGGSSIAELPQKWFGCILTPHNKPMEKYVSVSKYIDEESLGDAYDVEGRYVFGPFEAKDRKEAIEKYKEILKKEIGSVL